MPTKPYTNSDDWIICEWSDGNWCNEEDLYSYLEFLSNDYKRAKVLEYDEGYVPTKTEPI